MPDIAERTLELAKEALAEQEREVVDLRSRGATMLAAGGVVASLLGPEAFGGGRPEGRWWWLCAGLGLTGGAVLIVCAIVLFTRRRLAFGVGAESALRWCVRRGITTQPSVDLLLANLLEDVRFDNVAPLRLLYRCLRAASFGLVLLTTGLGAAAVA